MLLGPDREDEVGVLLGEEGELVLRAFAPALAAPLAAADRHHERKRERKDSQVGERGERDTARCRCQRDDSHQTADVIAAREVAGRQERAAAGGGEQEAQRVGTSPVHVLGVDRHQ